MLRPLFVLLLAVLVFFSGFQSILSRMELIEGSGTEDSSSDIGKISTTVQISQKQLDRLQVAVQSITPHLRETIEDRFFKLQDKIEHFMESKFNELAKKMDTKFHKTKTFIESKLTVIEDKISQYTSHVDSICKKHNNKNERYEYLSINVKLQELNKAIKNLTDIVVPSSYNKNISKQNAPTNSTEPAQNVPEIITTTEVTKPAPSKCDRTQQEQCCTVAHVGDDQYKVYTEMSARGRHTVVNMTSAGLQEYTMYFAVRGERVLLILSPTSPVIWSDLYYGIGFYDYSGGEIWMTEHLPTFSERIVHDIDTTNIISREKYSYYYVTLSGDTLEVGRRGEPPLMTHTSTKLRKLRYFSFKRYDYTGMALYDCTAV